MGALETDESSVMTPLSDAQGRDGIQFSETMRPCSNAGTERHLAGFNGPGSRQICANQKTELGPKAKGYICSVACARQQAQQGALHGWSRISKFRPSFFGLDKQLARHGDCAPIGTPHPTCISSSLHGCGIVVGSPTVDPVVFCCLLRRVDFPSCAGEHKDFEVYSCHISPDGKRLATAGGGASIRPKTCSKPPGLLNRSRWPRSGVVD